MDTWPADGCRVFIHFVFAGPIWLVSVSSGRLLCFVCVGWQRYVVLVAAPSFVHAVIYVVFLMVSLFCVHLSLLACVFVVLFFYLPYLIALF